MRFHAKLCATPLEATTARKACIHAVLLGKMSKPAPGIEPGTDGLQNRCSTAELYRQNY